MPLTIFDSLLTAKLQRLKRLIGSTETVQDPVFFDLVKSVDAEYTDVLKDLSLQ